MHVPVKYACDAPYAHGMIPCDLWLQWERLNELNKSVYTLPPKVESADVWQTRGGFTKLGNEMALYIAYLILGFPHVLLITFADNVASLFLLHIPCTIPVTI